MNRILIFLCLFLLHCTSKAQIGQERVWAETDQPCYIVGEHLKLNVNISLKDGTPTPSRVAYVEVADTEQLYAQAMLTLDDGRGYAEIPLPATMHSGTYQLCVYSRGLRNYGDSAFFTKQIGVINPVRLSFRDNIKILPAAEDTIIALLDRIPNSGAYTDTPLAEFPFGYELEGHIVTAQVSADTGNVENVRLALVGKAAQIYDGRIAANGNYEFFTTGIYGNMPSLVSAYSHDGKSLPIVLLSPYAQVIPAHLPQLTVRCSEKVLMERYTEALRQKAIDEWQRKDTLTQTVTFMTSMPESVYDLDEWTSMNTVQELLIEFIRGVHIKRSGGIQQLYTYSSATESYSQWPALVLLDGIPIYDVQRFLEYDAHLLKYVQIYSDRYTFGQTCCQGVVSFTTRSRKLSNYRLDEGSSFVSYQFPQPNQLILSKSK